MGRETLGCSEMQARERQIVRHQQATFNAANSTKVRKPAPKRKPSQKAALTPVVELKPFAGPATTKRRHTLLNALFVCLFLIPTLATAAYMFFVAQDQYSSHAGFAVRSETDSSPIEMLGGLASFSARSSSDTDILFEYIRGPALVREIDEALDLRAIYSGRNADPVFTFAPSGNHEDLAKYWRRMVRVDYDDSIGLIDLEVRAFHPDDAHAITTQILERSSQLINDLSAIAREDTMGFAEDDLANALNRLKGARSAMAEFRARTQIFDPDANVEGQIGLLNTLQAQLAEALIDRGLLLGSVPDGDPRLKRLNRRIEVIEDEIGRNRSQFGATSQSVKDEEFAKLISEYEALTVDLEFAQQSYLTSLASFDAAHSDAARKSRYIAPYLAPTKPESAEYPRRVTTVLLVGVFSFLTWALVSLFYYAARDRRG